MQKGFVLAAVAAVMGAAPATAIGVFEVAGQQAGSFNAPSAPSLVRTQSGSRGDLSWMAASRVIGQTPTSDVLAPSNTIGGGDPIYKPSSNKSGVVALIMETNAGNFICSGSLLAGGRHIATAAHCVAGTDGLLNSNRTTVHFFNGNPDQRTVAPGASHTMVVQEHFINPGYTGEVIDQNDIAILRLHAAAPMEFERYDLHTPSSLTGAVFNVAGYGARSTVGGAAGTTPPAGARTGYLREGDNRFDYALGNSLFQGFFTDLIGGTQFFGGVAEIDRSYVSDFDNGLAAQDKSRRIANAIGLGPIGDANFADTGLGAREVGIAGGDSGGPGFVNGNLASINSYGLSFGATFGDVDDLLNSSWGEFSGYVPVYIHQDFIAESTAVPEPASWAMLIAGFGLIGATLRRRRAVAA